MITDKQFAKLVLEARLKRAHPLSPGSFWKRFFNSLNSRKTNNARRNQS